MSQTWEMSIGADAYKEALKQRKMFLLKETEEKINACPTFIDYVSNAMIDASERMSAYVILKATASTGGDEKDKLMGLQGNVLHFLFDERGELVPFSSSHQSWLEQTMPKKSSVSLYPQELQAWFEMYGWLCSINSSRVYVNKEPSINLNPIEKDTTESRLLAILREEFEELIKEIGDERYSQRD